MIGRRGDRGSGISVLAARHDDDESCANTEERVVIAVTRRENQIQ